MDKSKENSRGTVRSYMIIISYLFWYYAHANTDSFVSMWKMVDINMHYFFFWILPIKKPWRYYGLSCFTMLYSKMMDNKNEAWQVLPLNSMIHDYLQWSLSIGFTSYLKQCYFFFLSADKYCWQLVFQPKDVGAKGKNTVSSSSP